MSKSNNAEDKDSIGYLKYDGKLVDEGILDARAAARALHGFDHSLRYFISQDRPDLAALEFPIPVKIERGSWWAGIPQSAETWIIAALGVAGTAYLTKAASKMAERDFAEIGLKDLFKKALKSVQWMIKIGKHLGTLAHKRLTGLHWSEDNQIVSIPNGKGEFLDVPRAEFERFLECPSSILSDMASVIELERQLTVGVNEQGEVVEVTVTRSERAIFFAEEGETGEILFPELMHGQYIELDGIVTRGNERTNSLGFLYKEHVLTCYPRQGSIVRFKPHLFLECRIVGVITRKNAETDELTESRPKIIFDELLLIDADSDQGKLL